MYNSPGVAAHYAALDYLTPCERLLFETHIRPGSVILDLGVGGGRTTRYLAGLASHYVGVDYAEGMVHACRRKFPNLEFLVKDASDLSTFATASFDAVVFAFNGIDYVIGDDRRENCLRHIHRILKPQGVVIFSSHNPRAVVAPPMWDRERLRRIARRFGGELAVLAGLLFGGLVCARVALAWGQVAVASLSRLCRRIPSPAFWKGEGYLRDSAHGGLLTHYSIPERTIAEMNRARFRVVRVMGDDYPRNSSPCWTGWYYYVFAKSDHQVSLESCA
ncbi:MAG TPA: class I SAM-dependent methyltransferase [Candidatus Solibacter sp.]|nr:class I SAM-dependent methyltransferase [Candidatus Solibacter sp.]